MSIWTDPAERLQKIRDEIAKETAKLPRVDHNGNVIEPKPESGDAE